MTGNPEPQTPTQIEIYDPRTGTFVLAGSTLYHPDVAFALRDGRILMTGSDLVPMNMVGPGEYWDRYQPWALVFDPTTGEFSDNAAATRGELRVRRCFPTVVCCSPAAWPTRHRMRTATAREKHSPFPGSTFSNRTRGKTWLSESAVTRSPIWLVVLLITGCAGANHSALGCTNAGADDGRGHCNSGHCDSSRDSKRLRRQRRQRRQRP